MKASTPIMFTTIITSILATGCSAATSAMSGANDIQTQRQPTVGINSRQIGASGTATPSVVNSSSQIAEVKRTSYDPSTHQVRIDAAMYGAPGQRLRAATVPSAYRMGENQIDLSSTRGLIDFVTAHYPNQKLSSIHFVAHSSQRAGVHKDFTVAIPTSLQDPVNAGNKPMFYPLGGAKGLPPGVKLSPNIRPWASPSTSARAKSAAVVQMARQQTGSPYIWGTNSKRRPAAFDTGSFTAYVYERALGYAMPTNTRAQARIGWQESRAGWRPGDLLIFDNGTHVGIYTGRNRFIQADGARNQVTSLNIAPGSAWHSHLTAVRRMF